MNGFWAVFVGFSYAAGSVVCHQLPDRSFHLYGVQLPVCARCTGLYLGGAIGLMAWLIRRALAAGPRPVASNSALVALFIAGLPTAVTVTTMVLGVWDPPNLGRAVSALPLGLAGGAVVGAVWSKDLR